MKDPVSRGKESRGAGGSPKSSDWCTKVLEGALKTRSQLHRRAVTPEFPGVELGAGALETPLLSVTCAEG